MEETNIHEVTDAEIVEATPATEPGPKNNKLKIALAILLVGVLVSGGVYFVLQDKANTVAVVNGMKITQKELADSINLITQNATMQGIDVTTPEIQAEINKQAMSVLVNNALIISGAGAAGITAEEEKIQSEYDKLVTELGGEDELKARMAEVDLTEEKLRSNIRERIVADAFIESQTDIEALAVTEEEVNSLFDSFYPDGIDAQKDEVGKDGAPLPSEEVIKAQIEQQILGQKRQEVVNALITKLHDEATIEIKGEETVVE